jgi:3-hydroxyisobutyrate dehydrogenase-like beta-hydroxyacid dehydrogenase
MIRRDFEPGFYVDHLIKDLSIALDEAALMGLALPGLALAWQLYEAVKAGEGGRLGTQALLLALERLNGVGGGSKSRRRNSSRYLPCGE